MTIAGDALGTRVESIDLDRRVEDLRLAIPESPDPAAGIARIREYHVIAVQVAVVQVFGGQPGQPLRDRPAQARAFAGDVQPRDRDAELTAVGLPGHERVGAEPQRPWLFARGRLISWRPNSAVTVVFSATSSPSSTVSSVG